MTVCVSVDLLTSIIQWLITVRIVSWLSYGFFRKVKFRKIISVVVKVNNCKIKFIFVMVKMLLHKMSQPKIFWSCSNWKNYENLSIQNLELYIISTAWCMGDSFKGGGAVIPFWYYFCPPWSSSKLFNKYVFAPPPHLGFTVCIPLGQ